MTPGARVQAAIEIIDEIIGGMPAEKALTRWGRASRFAGSKDRAAVRDHVFDVLRKWRSVAARGGGTSGRARMIGLLREQEADLELLFNGQGHAPRPLTAMEAVAGDTPDGSEARDLPDWAWNEICEGRTEAEAAREAMLLRDRAPVDLRVNLIKSTRETAQSALADEDICVERQKLARTSLRVVSGARKIIGSKAYRNGLVELQDAASQAVVECLPLQPGMRVLDYCAGGGGKSLAMAAILRGSVDAYDANPQRMKAIGGRAERSGARIWVVSEPRGQYDLVLCDAPCSGSGSWRRAPDAKWRMSACDLENLTKTQLGILRRAQGLVRHGGYLAYATCSLFRRENQDVVLEFMSEFQGFKKRLEKQFSLNDSGDGFYCVVLEKN